MRSAWKMTLGAVVSVGAMAWTACGGGSSSDSYVLPTSTTTATGGTSAGGGQPGGAGGGATGGNATAGMGGAGGGTTGLGVGEPCTDPDECRSGLTCDAGFCAPAHSTPEGGACTISAECAADLFCADGECAPGGTGGEGADCATDADCQSGMRCVIVGLSAECQPEGTGDVGASCDRSSDCYGALACLEGVCAVVPPGVPPFGPLWDGVVCNPDTSPVEAFFRVPRGSPADGDFYRLPMPNDVRLEGGHVDLTGHPTPGDELLGYDLVDRYLRALEQDADGWSAYGVITFRFSGPVGWDTLHDHLRLVDLTSGGGLGYYYQYVSNASRYVCGHRFVMAPLEGRAFRPGHTYAAFLTTDVKADNGTDIVRAADLQAMLAPTAPADSALAVAWPKYASFRAWLGSSGISPDTVLNATVFTVGHPQQVLERAALDIAAAAPAAVGNWTRCDDGVASPCPDATGPRACESADSDFDELHALVTLPIYQSGTAPYLTPADGGDFATDVGGNPIVERTEQVCLSLTIPKGAMPAGGWPTLVYAHGTGGHFRSHVTEGMADEFALGVDDGTGNVVRAAVLGIDQVAHGPRRAGSLETPETIYFNYANPAASRGYPRQGAVDQMSLLRLVPAIAFDAGSSPTGVAFSLAAPPTFWGHSQGAAAGALALPYGNWAGALLTGAGGSLRDSLTTKSSPTNIAAIVPWALGDPGGNGQLPSGHNHPVLTWLQNEIDPADPIAYGRLLVSEPPTGLTARHLFIPFGIDDTYTPGAVQAAYAASTGVELAVPDTSVTTPVPIGYPPLVPLATPLSGNRTVLGKVVTAAVRQYAPAAGDDGHFVAFDVAAARADAERFLAGALGGTMPRVGP